MTYKIGRKEYMRAYAIKNKEAIKQKQKAYTSTDEYKKMRRKRISEQYRNDEEYVVGHRLKANIRHRKYRAMIIDFLGGKCVKCGFSDFRALQVDHVNEGGVKELKTTSGITNPATYLNIIKENPDRYQLLCANCNWIKREERKEFPKSHRKYWKNS